MGMTVTDYGFEQLQEDSFVPCSMNLNRRTCHVIQSPRLLRAKQPRAFSGGLWAESVYRCRDSPLSLALIRAVSAASLVSVSAFCHAARA